MAIFIDFAALAAIYFLVFYKKWKQKGKEVLFLNTVMYIYLSFVLYFTLMPIITSLPFIFNHPYVPMNLEPFIDVVHSRGDFARQIILNIIMTIPFGFLLPLTQKSQSPQGHPLHFPLKSRYRTYPAPPQQPPTIRHHRPHHQRIRRRPRIHPISHLPPHHHQANQHPQKPTRRITRPVLPNDDTTCVIIIP